MCPPAPHQILFILFLLYLMSGMRDKQAINFKKF